MTPHRLVMGRNPRIPHEAAQRTFGAQPITCDVARNGSDMVQALKNFCDIRLSAMEIRLCHAAHGNMFEVIAEKAVKAAPMAWKNYWQNLSQPFIPSGRSYDDHQDSGNDWGNNSKEERAS